jgi:hypothetical protein
MSNKLPYNPEADEIAADDLQATAAFYDKQVAVSYEIQRGVGLAQCFAKGIADCIKLTGWKEGDLYIGAPENSDMQATYWIINPPLDEGKTKVGFTVLYDDDRGPQAYLFEGYLDRLY